VKASLNEIPEIDFTFLCDFTTLSHGDQLVFPHIKPLTKHQEWKTRPVLVKAVEEFQKAAESEWQQQKETDQEVISKIGRMQFHNVDKVMDEEIMGMWNINKKYEMIGGVENYFKHHDHFDLGFFNRGVTTFRV